MTSTVSAILGENSEFEGYPPPATRDPQWSFSIAKDLGRRFIPGEKAIASHAHYALNYAREIIKGRWPEGEYAIRRDPWKAYHYAKDIIGGRWPEAEKYILRNDWTASLYMLHVVKGRWPEAEESIARDATTAYNYADNILKSRFLAGEETIANSSVRDRYLRRFPEAKDDWILNGWIDWLDT